MNLPAVLLVGVAAAGIAALVYSQGAGAAQADPQQQDPQLVDLTDTGAGLELPADYSPGASDVNSQANLQAFLMMIRTAEGTAGSDGYTILFGGGHFSGFADHPRKLVTAKSGSQNITSSAAGAYQILAATWDDLRRAGVDLPDFSPASQDRAAVALIARRGALDDVKAGRFAQAVSKVRQEWASMPGAGYGQPERKLAQLQLAYQNAGGTYA